jgi:hypothetical protein
LIGAENAPFKAIVKYANARHPRLLKWIGQDLNLQLGAVRAYE